MTLKYKYKTKITSTKTVNLCFGFFHALTFNHHLALIASRSLMFLWLSGYLWFHFVLQLTRLAMHHICDVCLWLSSFVLSIHNKKKNSLSFWLPVSLQICPNSCNFCITFQSGFLSGCRVLHSLPSGIILLAFSFITFLFNAALLNSEFGEWHCFG